MSTTGNVTPAGAPEPPKAIDQQTGPAPLIDERHSTLIEE